MNCDEGLYVVLTSYRTGGTNTLEVSIDGTPVDGSPFTFETGFRQSWDVPPPTEPHTAKIVVTAWDDPTGSEGWSTTINLSMPACQEPTPTPTVAPTPTPTVAPTPTPTVAPTPTPTVAPTPQPTPTGTVEAATGTPKVTPPATDTAPASGGGPGSGLTLVLVLLAGSLLALLPAARWRTGAR
jgi:hypothetical protein